MKAAGFAVICVACTTQPQPQPQPAPSVTATASVSTAPQPSAIPIESAQPSAAPATSAAPEPERAWTRLEAERWATVLPGRWVGADKGDAIPGGQLGGVIVDGGARVIFARDRPGSKTPWNMTFWLPGVGHRNAETISGGCGFYESGKAFCRGYGIKAGKSEQADLWIDVSTDGQLKLQLPLSMTIVVMTLVRSP